MILHIREYGSQTSWPCKCAITMRHICFTIIFIKIIYYDSCRKSSLSKIITGFLPRTEWHNLLPSTYKLSVTHRRLISNWEIFSQQLGPLVSISNEKFIFTKWPLSFNLYNSLKSAAAKKICPAESRRLLTFLNKCRRIYDLQRFLW